jgi:ubiquinone/menaquinone biosynthesis C-methylase UbiE
MYDRYRNKSQQYSFSRPTYPKELIKYFNNKENLQSYKCAADIGAGTGIFSKILLDNMHQVYAVEPSEDMRIKLNQLKKDYLDIEVINGTVEDTNIKDQSIDLIVAAQSLHWFDLQKTKVEFRRILKERNLCLFIWNERLLNKNSFTSAYESLIYKFVDNYNSYITKGKEIISTLDDFVYPASIKHITFPNVINMNYEGIINLFFSYSYSPEYMPSSYETQNIIKAIDTIFKKYSNGQIIQVQYITNVYYCNF